MIQIAEIDCASCGEIIAHVQVVPKTIFVHGEAWCPECFKRLDDDEEE